MKLTTSRTWRHLPPPTPHYLICLGDFEHRILLTRAHGVILWVSQRKRPQTTSF